MKILKKSNRKIKIYSAVFILAALLIWFGYNTISKIDSNEKVGEVKISEENPSWNIYSNDEYNFSIGFPSDWEIYEDFEKVSPTINIYLPRNDLKPPFDHFADLNNVSIFPKGLQTEAVIGQHQDTQIDFNFKSDDAIDYVLEDGTTWATYVSFDDFNEPWKPWGFIWTRNIIEDIEYKCKSSGVEISLDECNPFEGDEFVRSGTVNQEIRKTQEEIIKSFILIEN